MVEFYAAIGQFLTYRNALRRQEAERALYLAVPNEAFETLFNPAHSRDLRAELALALLVYDAEEETIVQWIE